MIDQRLDDVIALPAGLISDNEDDDKPIAPLPSATPDETPWIPPRLPVSAADQATPVEFNLNGPPMTDSEGGGTQGSARPTSTTNVIIDEEDRQPSNLAKLLMLHHQYGHISFAKLQEMAKQGITPRRLSKCRVPICSACLYSKMIWRGKPLKKNGRETELSRRPGQVVSVDQLVSHTPGLIAQMTGFLATRRYKYITIYVDQFSRLGFIYLQKTASAEETIEGKKAFDTYARRQWYLQGSPMVGGMQKRTVRDDVCGCECPSSEWDRLVANPRAPGVGVDDADTCVDMLEGKCDSLLVAIRNPKCL
jgi:hypothetical protein